MIIKTKTANRLGIYFFYDGDGVVDKYIDYFLYDYAKCFNHLVVVCNGKLNDSGRKIFEKYTSDIIDSEERLIVL